MNYTGQRILVLGLGLTGLSLALPPGKVFILTK